MECSAIQELFIECADGSLDRHQLAIFEQHLAVCPDCAQDWQDYRQTIQMLNALPFTPAPADLLMGIHRKLSRHGYRRWLARLQGAIDFSVPIPVAAASFALAMLAAFVVKTASIDQATRPSLADRRPTISADITPRSSRNAHGPSVPVSLGGRPRTVIGVSEPSEPQCPIAPTALATHQSSSRILSPDLRILVEGKGWDDQPLLAQKMLDQNWQVHALAADLLLVHLPASELDRLHLLLKRHRHSLMPELADTLHFADKGKIIAVAIRFR